jgi:hypothetical protein
MGERATKQFNKRFKAGIEIRFAESPLSPAEQEYRNKCLREAISAILKGLLGREPSHEELTGQVDTSLNKGITRRKKTLR